MRRSLIFLNFVAAISVAAAISSCTTVLQALESLPMQTPWAAEPEPEPEPEPTLEHAPEPAPELDSRMKVRVGMPLANRFGFDFGEGRRGSSTGYGGLLLGIDYEYADTRFMSWQMAIALSYKGIEKNGQMLARHFTFSHNHLLARGHLALGYGICFGADEWHSNYLDPERGRQHIMHSTNTLGLALPVYIHTGFGLCFGVVYRPTFVQFSHGPRLRTNHTASLEACWLWPPR